MKKQTRTVPGMILLGLVLFFVSCGGDSGSEDGTGVSESSGPESDSVDSSLIPPVSGDPEGVSAFIFASDEAVPVLLSDLGEEIKKSNTPLMPWVSQIRVVDFIRFEDSIYFPVNNRGFGVINRAGEDPVPVFPDSNEFFAGRTLGNIYRQDERIVCQFYGDRVFSDESVTGEPSLMEFFPREGRLSEIYIPLGRRPSEELVEAVFRSDEWLLSWKSIDERGVSFRFRKYTPSSGALEGVDSEEYRRILAPPSLETAPSEAADLVRRSLPEPENGLLYLVKWCYPDGGDERTCYYGDSEILTGKDGEVFMVEGLTDRRKSFLMDPGCGKLFVSDMEEPLLLPELPESCGYTGFFTDESNVYLSWEEQHFPFVGASGIIIMNL